MRNYFVHAVLIWFNIRIVAKYDWCLLVNFMDFFWIWNTRLASGVCLTVTVSRDVIDTSVLDVKTHAKHSTTRVPNQTGVLETIKMFDNRTEGIISRRVYTNDYLVEFLGFLSRSCGELIFLRLIIAFLIIYYMYQWDVKYRRIVAVSSPPRVSR